MPFSSCVFCFYIVKTDYVTVTNLDITPDPVAVPGKVGFDITVEIKKPIKDVKMVLKIVRNTFLLDVTLPCAKQIGSW